MKIVILPALLALSLGVGAVSASPPIAVAAVPSEIIAAAPAADWVGIAPSDLLVMDLAANAAGRPRRVVIQLMPAPFSQGWIGNIRTLAAAHWWDGTSVNRVQDNYVTQWGDADAEDRAKARAIPTGLAAQLESDYVANLPEQTVLHAARQIHAAATRDPYADLTFAYQGWPLAVAIDNREPFAVDATTGGSGAQPLASGNRRASASGSMTAWPVHCYGTVGVGRDMPPDTGSGAELYAVIGHAPRHLDRNIAVVGRVIEGIEFLSSLPRGTGELGFYRTAAERVPIVSIRIGDQVPGLPRYEYLSTESGSFARYADARANRRDPFFIVPAGGADICNVPVPVRRVEAEGK